jgi:hypothetical protein
LKHRCDETRNWLRNTALLALDETNLPLVLIENFEIR